jgi:ubiquitin-protein ligase E3 C
LLFESELAPGFLNILLGRSNQLDDLIHLDNTLYRSLIDMKRRANVGEDISSYGLHFEMSHDIFGKHVTEEIKPNGSNIAVTNSNLREYILLLANYKQNVMIRSQCRAFIKGFREMIPLDWIRMFHVRELQLVIGGDQRKIDVQDMKRHTAYHGYAENERYIQSFWKIVEEMDIEDQCNLLRFVTSCPRQPLLGFGQLQPKLGIQKVNAYEYAAAYDGRNLNDRDRDKAAKLPTAATCMNLLKLPYYNSDELLKEKLLYAIRSKSGFELS